MQFLKNYISKMNNFDKATELSAIALLIYAIYFVFNAYSSLPDTIPTHFGIDGKADAWGNKATLFILPSVSIFVYLLLTGISFLPSNMMNYPVKITDENKERQHQIALKLLRILKLVIVALFFYISYQVVNSIKDTSDGLGVWFLPIFLIVVFSPIIYYIRKAIKLK